MTETKFMFRDAMGERGPYTAVHAEGPWYCMIPEGVDVPPEMLRSGGMLVAKQVLAEHADTMRSVAWASERGLLEGLRPGFYGSVGWTPVES